MATEPTFCPERFLSSSSADSLGNTGLALVGMAAFVVVVFTSCGVSSLMHHRREQCRRREPEPEEPVIEMVSSPPPSARDTTSVEVADN